MQSWGKSREEKPRKHPKTPSFSSNLLDEIMRSIDNEKYEEDLNIYKAKSSRKQNNSSSNGGGRIGDDQEIASLKRVYSRRKVSSLPIMENKSHKENDSMFFSTSSSSSDSSSGNLSVSSDAEIFSSGKSSRTIHCFAAPWPKQQPKKANNVPPNPGRFQNPLYYEKSHEYYMFDDYKSYKSDENLNKKSSKSKPLNIYSSLKKMKQPISPGFRLTSFINSLFSNGNAKKTKNVSVNRGLSSEDYSKSTNASTCSSASSFTRSCLSKSAPDSRAKFNNGVERKVNFYPVSVILDEDSRPCGHKSIYNEDFESFRRPHSSQKSQKSQIVEIKNRKIEEGKRDGVKGYQNEKKNNLMVEKIVRDKIGSYEDVDDDDDADSDSSSDLFEIDHLDLFGKDGFSQELPVYETTRLDRNNYAIARGLIC